MKEFDKTICEIYNNYENEVSDIRFKMAKKKVIIFGAGELGHTVYERLKCREIQIEYFCDNFLKGNVDKRTGLKIVGMDEVLKDRENLLVLIAVFDEKVFNEIYQLFIDNGFSNSQLINTKILGEVLSLSYLEENLEKYKKAYLSLYDDFSRKVYLKRMQKEYLPISIASIVSSPAEEYFDEQVKLTQEEIFIDCGGYTGDTSLKFINQTNGNYKKIVIFEPEISKQELIKKNMKDYKYELYQYGAWSCNTVMSFDDRGDSASRISTNGKVQIEVRALDDIIYKENPTYIKMDIEGAETEALKGCERTIKKFKPKLAVCIYHKPEDLFEVPLLLKALRDDYKLFIRQYDDSKFETICYAL